MNTNIGWEKLKLREIATIRRGASPRPINAKKYFSTKGRGWIRIADVSNTSKYLKETTQYLSDLGVSNSVKVEPDDVIMSICATIGKPIIIKIPACIHDGFVLFSDYKKDVNREYLFYYLQHNEYNIRSKKQVGTQGNLNTTIVGNQVIWLPKLPEQTAIANILSTVDEAIQKADEAITKIERIKQAMMQKLLSEGIGHNEFKQTKIGKIPKEWEIVTLSKICKLFRENYEPQRNGSLPFIGLEHIIPGAFYTDKYGVESEVRSSKSKFSSGDILYGKLRPYLDKVVISRVEGISSTDVLVITPQKNLSISVYLLLVLHSKRFINFSIARTSGTNHPRVNWKDISKFTIGLPPIEEQKKIASIILDLQQKLELANQRKKKLGTIKLGLMDDLLTGRKRVKIN